MAQKTCKCGVKLRVRGGDSMNRILGGHETKEHEYPWQVKLDFPGSSCGGTLISDTHVLTAAHCTLIAGAATSIRVLLGGHNIADENLNWVDVAEIINHPDYNSSEPRDNDFAILRLAKAVTFTNKVSPACLPADRSATFVGVTATVTGWGTLSRGANGTTGIFPDVLQGAEVTVTTNAECNDKYARKGQKITKNMICAGDAEKNLCGGDSGGPLVASENGVQAVIGVVSFSTKSCGQMDGFPGVYARVTEQMNWILENTAGTFSSDCSALN